MIFVTVGSDIPFNRLVETVDSWAMERERKDVFAQIGIGGKKPNYISYATLLDPVEFNRRFSEAEIIVGHAGMGTILSALQSEKPILVMPRRGGLKETRNDHQFATAKWLAQKKFVKVAMDAKELHQYLDSLETIKSSSKISSTASPELVQSLRNFIFP